MFRICDKRLLIRLWFINFGQPLDSNLCRTSNSSSAAGLIGTSQQQRKKASRSGWHLARKRRIDGNKPILVSLLLVQRTRWCVVVGRPEIPWSRRRDGTHQNKVLRRTTTTCVYQQSSCVVQCPDTLNARNRFREKVIVRRPLRICLAFLFSGQDLRLV